MSQETILFSQGIDLPDSILALTKTMQPEGFNLIHVPPGTSGEEIGAAMQDADYLLGFLRYIPDEAFQQASRLKLIQVLSAGYDSVNIDAARNANIPVATNGGANSVAVAEHTIMLMLAVYRKLAAYHANVAAGQWHKGIPRTVDIYEMEGKTVGLVGLGNIGREVAKRLQGFGCELIYFDTQALPADTERQLGARLVLLDELLAQADIVSLHIPLNDHTHELINAKSFARMKNTAILINTCRGGVIKENDLIDALREGTILAAGLDALAKEPPEKDNPLLGLPNVTLTPHSAGPTHDSFRKRFRNGFANIQRVSEGLPAKWVIPEMHDLFPPG
ncbi:MAG: 2-hydroxyacid dehydrogenase [Pseudomonadales bacterium]|nr:2-hydroxyacid dehydrogenase [Pseudomonadales bacterium]